MPMASSSALVSEPPSSSSWSFLPARRSSLPCSPLSAQRAAAAGWLWWLRVLHLSGVDLCEAEGDAAAQPLHFAAANGQLNTLRFLVHTCHVPASTCTADGWQAVHCAAAGGYQPCVAWLLEEAGQSCEAKTQPSGHRPLHCAAVQGHIHTVRYLVQQQRVELLAHTHDGHTALHLAAAGGSEATLRFLAAAAPPQLLDDADAQGRTALHHAARRGQRGCVAALLHLACSVTATDSFGFDAAALAAMQGWGDCARLCVEERERRGQRVRQQDCTRLLQLIEQQLQAEAVRSSSHDQPLHSERRQRLLDARAQMQLLACAAQPAQLAHAARPAAEAAGGGGRGSIEEQRANRGGAEQDEQASETVRGAG